MKGFNKLLNGLLIMYLFISSCVELETGQVYTVNKGEMDQQSTDAPACKDGTIAASVL